MPQSSDPAVPAVIRAYQAAVPLWQVAPARDADGQSVADFMLLIPRMAQRGPAFAEHAREVLQRVCAGFEGQVQFADLNLRTGAIWISVQARPGLCREVAWAIRAELPQAVTVGGQLGVVHTGLPVGSGHKRTLGWISRIRQRVVRRLLPGPPDNGSR